MHRILFINLFIIISISGFGQNQNWSEFKSEYLDQYRSMKIPELRLAYVDNFNDIGTEEEIERQLRVFERMKKALDDVEIEQLGDLEWVEFESFKYVAALNLKRLKLEIKWNSNRPSSIPVGGMHQLDRHKAWYQYYLMRWLDISVHVDTLYEFGLNEIARAKSKINTIRKKTGFESGEFSDYLRSPQFFAKDKDTVQQLFEDYEKWLRPKLARHFPDLNDIPPIKIKRGENAELAQVPGYYSSNTFYYNLFDKPFNKRQVAFLYLHEAFPGHHYEVNHRQVKERMNFAPLINLPGYGEGWAAYVEEIAYELGFYRDIYDELGRWEWDLIRSVRVVLDIGLNYHSWNDEDALGFWKQHIKGQDEIGKREIARMRRWPVQVITYKYGASKLLEWKHILEANQDFDLLEFHKAVLRYGPLPYSVLENYFIRKATKD